MLIYQSYVKYPQKLQQNYNVNSLGMVQGGPKFWARNFVPNPVGSSDILHKNSRGKTNFELHLTHKLVLNKYSKSLKKLM